MVDEDEISSLVKLVSDFEDKLLRLAPKKYKPVFRHFIRARIEFLKGIEELIRVRREELEKRLEESGGPRKEKVEIE